MGAAIYRSRPESVTTPMTFARVVSDIAAVERAQTQPQTGGNYIARVNRPGYKIAVYRVSPSPLVKVQIATKLCY